MKITIDIPDPPFMQGQVLRVSFPEGGQLVVHILSVKAGGYWNHTNGAVVAWAEPVSSILRSDTMSPALWEFRCVAQEGSTYKGQPTLPYRPGKCLVLSELDLAGAAALPDFATIVGPDTADNWGQREDAWTALQSIREGSAHAHPAD
jgi:hypothetical protein